MLGLSIRRLSAENASSFDSSIRRGERLEASGPLADKNLSPCRFCRHPRRVENQEYDAHDRGGDGNAVGVVQGGDATDPSESFRDSLYGLFKGVRPR